MTKQIYAVALACVFGLGLATKVSASTGLDFSATDGSDVTAVGSINVSGGFATSGTIDFEGSGWLTFPGIYTLCTDYSETAEQGGFGALPGDFTSPNGYFYFNNAFSGTGPYIDDAGLLFTLEVPDQQIFDNGSLVTGTLTSEVSLWWDGSQYIIADDFNGPEAALNGSEFPYDADQSPNGQYEFTGTLKVSQSAPEPGASMLMLSGLALVSVLAARRRA